MRANPKKVASFQENSARHGFGPGWERERANWPILGGVMRKNQPTEVGPQARPPISDVTSALSVVWWPIGRPKPYPKNARKWSHSAVEKVAASIKSFGWVQPIVCDRDDIIVIGHLRLASAHFLGLTEVPVHVASNLSPAQIKALR